MIHESSYQQYLEALLSGNKAICRDIVQQALDQGVGVEGIYVGLFQRSMYRVGELWECNRISVAVEHLATSVTESLFSLIYPMLFASERVGRSAVVACVASEYHQLGGKMVADVFELHGWDGYFLGANTPVHDLLRMLDDKQPDLLALSLSVYFNLPTLLDVVKVVQQEHPELRILVGGQAFRWGGKERLDAYPSATYVPSLQQLRQYIARG